MIVVDTNVLAYLWIPGPQTERCTRLLRQDPSWVAPPLWRSELRNVLVNHLRLGATTIEGAIEAMEAAEAQMGPATIEVESDPVLRLAEKSGCSAYDCEFAVLAMQTGVPFVTADRKLLKAFPGVARSLDEAVKEE